MVFRVALLAVEGAYTLPRFLRWAGVVLGLTAVWLGYAAHRTRGTSFTATIKTQDDHRLVGKGVYGWIRHPMYTSFFALLVTSALLTTNWLIGALGLVYSLLIVQRVSDEEAMLLETFGDDYRRYMGRKGRFLPSLFGWPVEGYRSRIGQALVSRML